jgi:hypothetical protein
MPNGEDRYLCSNNDWISCGKGASLFHDDIFKSNCKFRALFKAILPVVGSMR